MPSIVHVSDLHFGRPAVPEQIDAIEAMIQERRFDVVAISGDVSQRSRAGEFQRAAVFIRDANLLILPMVGIGIAWASILTMPYVILAGALPPRKMGVYMGIFNFFIVIPQLIVATVMGAVITRFFPGQPIWTMLFAAIVMVLAALAMLRVKEGEAS